MTQIEVINFTKNYGKDRGVFNVSFKINKGEVFGFLGPNGAGKSTVIRHLMGFSKGDSGETKIFNKETFSNYYNILKDVGYLPGEIALPAGLTGWQFIDMMKKLKQIKNDDRLNYLLKLFELDPGIETKKMSLGDKRKLAIVTAFMGDPEILILDEPTSSLDLEMQQVFIELITEEKKKGKTILLSSHIFSEIDATCDRIAIIKKGKIVSEFIADELRHANNKNFMLEFENSDDLKIFNQTNKNSENYKIMNVNKIENKLLVNVDDNNINALVKVLSKLKIIAFEHLKETLEDYFMKYYRETKKTEIAL